MTGTPLHDTVLLKRYRVALLRSLWKDPEPAAARRSRRERSGAGGKRAILGTIFLTHERQNASTEEFGTSSIWDSERDGCAAARSADNTGSSSWTVVCGMPVRSGNPDPGVKQPQLEGRFYRHTTCSCQIQA